jgi:HlyD family secretion protein
MKSKKVWTIVTSLVAILFISWKFLYTEPEGKTALETKKVAYDTLSNFITATGTVEPITQVEVSTQVSGKIEKVYVDYNDHVKKNQLIAEIDKTNLESALENAETSLKSAKTDMDYQGKNYNRIKILYEKMLVSQTDMETAEYNFDNAKTSYEKAKLAYDVAKQNLSYAYIYSPIDGVVLVVSIKEGQTVAASLSAPTMFTIANDLTKMRVEAEVDEADIGQVKIGQEVSFTVDAFPYDNFSGSVSQVRLDPTTKSNVVTYTVIVDAPNPEGKLMPGMTASITVITQKEEDVLTIPEKATRFSPEKDLDGVGDLSTKFKIIPLSKNNASENEKIVWVKYKNELTAKKIKTGLSDGSNIEVLNGLNSSDEVVLGISENTELVREDSGSQQSSPFMPKRPGQK